jgi:hypothetical protein
MTETMAEMVTGNGKEPRTISVKLGTGQPWNAPVEVIRTMLASMSEENPGFVGRHLQGALMGEMPAKTGRKSNSPS